MSGEITYPQGSINDLTQPQPKLTPDQAEALVRLIARATKHGFLPSVPDTWRLLELVDGAFRPIVAAQETLADLREQYHSLPLEDRLTVRRTLQEMAEEAKNGC